MALFNDQEQELIRNAIAAAEKRTSGQIRVCVEKTCSVDVLDRAAQYFVELEMHQTRQHHGVLIYLAMADRKFAIIGDTGINNVVPETFWDETKEAMLQYFKNGDLVEGIATGLNMAGEQMAKYFPHQDSDINELPDDIAFMNGN
jgi:uncharacterized membrane protein